MSAATQNRAAQDRVFPLPFTAPALRRHRLCPWSWWVILT